MEYFHDDPPFFTTYFINDYDSNLRFHFPRKARLHQAEKLTLRQFGSRGGACHPLAGTTVFQSKTVP